MSPLTALAIGDAATPTRHQPAQRRTVITSDGVALSVSDLHPTSPVTHTVVPLHGLCLTRQSWYRPAQRFRRPGIRVIQYDNRGHGRSDGAPLHTYTPERLAQDLAEVLTALQVSGPLILACHSMGGVTALKYLARPVEQQPVRPDGLVLVATWAGNLTEHGLARLLAMPGIDTAMALARHAPHMLSERVMRSLARPLCEFVTHDKTVSASLSQAFRSTPMATALGFLHSLKTFDERQVLPTISAATTVISGGADLLTPPAHSEEMAAGIVGATHIHLPAAGHMLLQEAASIVGNAVLHTINDIATSS
ncbi:alpha/beta fold hydrolase [Mycolicibacterium lutetiense]|uniref:Pimeloyl-ACP methyl ester carboxylesterase n=1 Tax=Mycolicibacterium lutetiense TaxID=1641992 RepID=A0ABS5A3D1_9MYCO|nr:alpha/beta hydrolase [Mycolicibacterium lutetiense]MBP2456274.1 pimeloyl-ACP methyl ester carboxylesterase [Mycolicibacterium lutetiense]